jgi:hypothetical protein
LRGGLIEIFSEQISEIQRPTTERPKTMSNPDINVSLSDADVQKIKDIIGQVRAAMPFLITLTTKDRMGKYKMGPQRLAWVQACVNAASNHPEVLPGFFKQDQYAASYDTSQAMADIREVLRSLLSDVEDTTMQVGSQAASGSSSVMGWIDAGADTEPGLKSVSASLHEFFQRANAAGTQQPPPTAAAAKP